MKKLIYIASPYAGDVEKNIEFARAACRHCMAQGNVPVAVHLLYPQMLDDSNPEERALGLELGREVLARCDELHVYGEQISSGMAAEISLAWEMNIPVTTVASKLVFEQTNPAMEQRFC